MSARPIYGFMHVAVMNHWDEVVRRQIWKISESGLLQATRKIRWGVVGAPDSLLFNPTFMSRTEISVKSHDLGLFELPTLSLLEETCRREDCIVWYIHTKGVSYNPPKPNCESWREYMEYFVIENWRKCLAAIEGGADAAGTLWSSGCRHFAGNFWWSASSHVRRLPPVSSLDRKDRLSAETWIGQPIPKVRRKILDLYPFANDYSVPREKYPPADKFNSIAWEG